MKGILLEILDPRGTIDRKPWKGGMTAVSTSPSTAGKTGQYQEGEFGAADFSTESNYLVTIP